MPPTLLTTPDRWPEPASLASWDRPLAPLSLPESRPPGEDCGEPLVEIEGEIDTIAAYAAWGIGNEGPMRLRSGVLERLVRADAALPDGLGLVVLDGWRPIRFQHELLAYYENLHGSVAGYVADPNSDTMAPPHTTGGALDVSLTFGGRPLALGTEWDDFHPGAHADALEDTPGPERLLRRVLTNVLGEQGFVGYPLEWWHFSHGEDVWAANTGEPAIYRTIA